MNRIQFIAALVLGLSSAIAFAAEDISVMTNIQQITDIRQLEGTYNRVGTGCEYATQATMTEEVDPRNGETCYHLRILRQDGRVWNSREFRQLNGAAWYKADMGNDGTISGRSRYACTGTECTLWNERKTCSGLILPRCTAWQSSKGDPITFENSTMTFYSDSEGTCTFVKQ